MSVLVRPPHATGWDEFATCNSCHSPALIAVVEVDSGTGANTIRLCEPCMDTLVKGATRIKLNRMKDRP